MMSIAKYLENIVWSQPLFSSLFHIYNAFELNYFLQTITFSSIIVHIYTPSRPMKYCYCILHLSVFEEELILFVQCALTALWLLFACNYIHTPVMVCYTHPSSSFGKYIWMHTHAHNYIFIHPNPSKHSNYIFGGTCIQHMPNTPFLGESDMSGVYPNYPVWEIWNNGQDADPQAISMQKVTNYTLGNWRYRSWSPAIPHTCMSDIIRPSDLLHINNYRLLRPS